MNDLREKNDDTSDGAETTGEHPHAKSRLYYKKLEAYLLLLYQAYLKKETLLDAEIKATIWRMVQLQEDFPMKIRMLQLELLGYETDNFDGPWDAVKDSLFPIKDFELLAIVTAERKKEIAGYSKAVRVLLKSTDSSELG